MSPDATRQEEFAGFMADVLNKGALGLLVSVGHQTGLFDTMSTLPPSTSADIAKAAELDERYVREWLGGMVVGGIVEYGPDGATYTLPPSTPPRSPPPPGPTTSPG